MRCAAPFAACFAPPHAAATSLKRFVRAVLPLGEMGKDKSPLVAVTTCQGGVTVVTLPAAVTVWRLTVLTPIHFVVIALRELEYFPLYLSYVFTY